MQKLTAVLEAPRVVRALDGNPRLVAEVDGLHHATDAQRCLELVHRVLRLVLQDSVRLFIRSNPNQSQNSRKTVLK